MSKRTLLVFALALAVVPAPPAIEAQQAGRVYHVGLFHVGLDHVPPSLDGLREGLKALGWEDGKNVRFDWRNLADEDAAREVAKQFVRDRVDLIVAFEPQTIRAAIAATSRIPIVMLHVADPVADGFIKSFARPGGNVTGFAGFGAAPSKEIELFKGLVPRLRRLLVLFDPQDPAARRSLTEIRSAAGPLKVRLVEREATDEADIDRLFGSVKPGDVDGVYLLPGNLRTKFHALVLRLASAHHLPMAGNRREWVERGALFSYNDNIRAVGRAAARYVDSILKGSKPTDLPVEQVSQYELVVNLKTANALGLTVSQPFLLRADAVIQ